MGKVCVALTYKTMLIVNETRKPAYHQYISLPLVSFAFPKQEAKATSNNPAIINSIQFIFLCFYILQRYYIVPSGRFLDHITSIKIFLIKLISSTYIVFFRVAK